MGAPVRIIGRDGKTQSEVTPFGQLVVAPLAFSTPATASILTPAQQGVAFNVIGPKQGHIIVITDILLSTNKDVGPDGSLITIYEATTADELASLGDILEVQLLKNIFAPISGLNLGVPQGRFVNIRADDDDVFVTIMFYRAKI